MTHDLILRRERMSAAVQALGHTHASTGLDADEEQARIALGHDAMDAALRGGLARGACHDLHAGSEADIMAATGFALGLAARAKAGFSKGGAIIRARQAFLDTEAGRIYPSGLVEFGINPARVTLLLAKDAKDVLQVALEAARCADVAVVLIELWGDARALDLTASRRLALAAREAGTCLLTLRVATEAQPSAAETRWRIRAAPSRAAPANAPGAPAFAVTLERSRAGVPEQTWQVEWSRERGCFEPREAGDRINQASPLSRPVVPVFADRPAAPTIAPFRRAG